MVVIGKEEIGRAYRSDTLADDYIASRYQADPFGRALHERQARVVRKVIKGLRVRHLLEVAPGPARLTVHTPPVESACAVEQSPAMLRIASARLLERGRSDWRLILGDGFRLPLPSGRFDLAMSFKLIRHFDKPDRLALLAELRRVLRAGGHALFDVANAQATRWLLDKWGIGGSWVDDHWFTRRDFEAEMAEAGFRVERMYAVHPALRLQYYTFAALGRRSPAAATAVSRCLELATSHSPNEWVALCRRV